MVNIETNYILKINIANLNYDNLINYLKENIENDFKTLISYATVNSVNLAHKNYTRNLFCQFNIIHSDGIGVYLASKFIFGRNGLRNRFTGSDFYPILIKEGEKKKWKFFLFGDSTETLLGAVERNKNLNICGYQNGFNYDDDEVVKKINYFSPDVLVVGLGCPKQEEWIVKFKDNLNARVILAVGDGIKVFAWTKKRGFAIFRKLGLEWFVRLINHPIKYWNRYIIGIPIFIFRVIKFKLSDNYSD